MQLLEAQAPDATVHFTFDSYEASGGSIAPSAALEAADIRIYDMGSGSEVQWAGTGAITVTSPFDSEGSVHCVSIDLSNNTDDGFFDTSVIEVRLHTAKTIDGQTVRAKLARIPIGYERVQNENGQTITPGAMGAGSEEVTVTVSVGGTPVAGAAVWVATDQAGTNTVAGTVYTNGLGVTPSLWLDPGTYYVFRQAEGYNLSNPQTITVTAS